MSRIIPMRSIIKGASGRVHPTDTEAYLFAQGVQPDSIAYIFFFDGRVFHQKMQSCPAGYCATIHTSHGKALAAVISMNGRIALLSTNGKKLTDQQIGYIEHTISHTVCAPSPSGTPNASAAPPTKLHVGASNVPPMPSAPLIPTTSEPLPQTCPAHSASTPSSIPDEPNEHVCEPCPCHLSDEDNFNDWQDESPDNHTHLQDCEDMSTPMQMPISEHIPVENDPMQDPLPFTPPQDNEHFSDEEDNAPCPCEAAAQSNGDLADLLINLRPVPQIYPNAFARNYPNVNWTVHELPHADHYMSAHHQGRKLTAVAHAPSAYPPAGIPPRARYLVARNGKGYWVY